VNKLLFVRHFKVTDKELLNAIQLLRSNIYRWKLMQLEHGQKKTGVKLEHEWKTGDKLLFSLGNLQSFARRPSQLCNILQPANSVISSGIHQESSAITKSKLLEKIFEKGSTAKLLLQHRQMREKKREKKEKEHLSIVLRNKAGYERKHNRKE